MSRKFVVRPKEYDKKEDKYITMTIRIEKDLQEKFDSLSSKSSRSRNELIGMALKYAIDNLEFIDSNPDDENAAQ